jgi:hypothetical protein
VVLEDTLAVGEVVAGQGFLPEDAAERVAIVGREVFVEDYTQPSGAMPGMVHLFEIGQSFVLPDAEARLRVVGRYSAGDRVLDRVVFLPLATAQRLYGLEGRVTHVLVTVDSPANAARVAEEVRAVLAAQQQE